MAKYKFILTEIFSYILIWVPIFFLLSFIGFFYNYLLFQTIIGLFNAIISISIFIIVLNNHKHTENKLFTILIGITMLLLGLFDITRVLTGSGMNLTALNNQNLSAQIWVISRLLLAAGFLAGCFFYNRKINFNILLIIYTMLGIILFLLIFYFKIIPGCYSEENGIFFFGKISEYVIIFLFMASIILIYIKRNLFSPDIFYFLLIFFAISIFIDLFSYLFKQTNVEFNLALQWLTFLSYFLIYKIFSKSVITDTLENLSNGLLERDNKNNELIEELNEKNKDMEQISYIISHDLRTPMTNIQGFTKAIEFSVEKISKLIKSCKDIDGLQKDVDKLIVEEISAFRKYIQSSIGKIDSLITGLLQVTQIGREAINISRIDLNLLINEILNSFNYSIKKNNIILDVDTLPSCMGDKSQINQIFYHLIDNAIKYSNPDRQIIIKITGKSGADFNTYCIEDNGAGIELKNQKIIFDLFKRINPDNVTGEGIGLAIVSKILSRHKGKIWLESEKGKGSKFYFTLPSNI